MPLMLAQGTLLAGMIANRIFYTGAYPTDFKVDIAGIVVVALALALAPLLVFSPQLGRTKRVGGREYGRLAQRYVREFDRKWLRGGAAPDELLIIGAKWSNRFLVSVWCLLLESSREA
jgi:hypothetical protein